MVQRLNSMYLTVFAYGFGFIGYPTKSPTLMCSLVQLTALYWLSYTKLEPS